MHSKHVLCLVSPPSASQTASYQALRQIYFICAVAVLSHLYFPSLTFHTFIDFPNSIMQQKLNILQFCQEQISCLIKYDYIGRLPLLGHMEQVNDGKP